MFVKSPCRLDYPMQAGRCREAGSTIATILVRKEKKIVFAIRNAGEERHIPELRISQRKCVVSFLLLEGKQHSRFDRSMRLTLRSHNYHLRCRN